MNRPFDDYELQIISTTPQHWHIPSSKILIHAGNLFPRLKALCLITVSTIALAKKKQIISSDPKYSDP